MLSPHELKKVAFSKAIKGYAASEVEEYIRYLLTMYSEVYNEYAVLEQKYKAALEQLDSVKNEENAISATIVNAQKMADAIVSDAKEKAAGIKSAVSDSCDRILDVYMTKVTAEREKLAECEAAVNEFKTSLLNAYKKHLDLIYDIMPDEEPTPYLSDQELEDKAVEIANEKIADIVSSFDNSASESCFDSVDEENVSSDSIDTESDDSDNNIQ